VEIKPDMIVDTSAVGLEGKKIKKETKEDRMKKLERRVREVELIFIQRQQQQQQQQQRQRQAYVGSYLTPGPSHLQYRFEQQTESQQFDGRNYDREMEVQLNRFEQGVDDAKSVGAHQPLPGSIESEEEIERALKHDMDFTSGFEQRNGCGLDSGSFFPELPLRSDGDATSIAAAGDRFCPESFNNKEDGKLDMNVLSDLSLFNNAGVLLPPPLHPYSHPLLDNVDLHEQATLFVQNEICERSTKITALMQRLMPLSMENPHSENYNPAGLDLQIVDRNGKGSEDNVIKTVVL